MIKEEIEKILARAIKKEFGHIKLPNVLVEKPKDVAHGDYSSSIALAISREFKKNPMEVAQKIAGAISNGIFKKVEAAKPGFINFFLNDEFFNQNIQTILREG